mmetsp:Transcript_95047/g.292994  ORF Transcript_95047/g.292994 Transcript_95047/m.292994 type:complete len:251 (-) Transcript_95047:66-818(-)
MRARTLPARPQATESCGCVAIGGRLNVGGGRDAGGRVSNSSSPPKDRCRWAAQPRALTAAGGARTAMPRSRCARRPYGADRPGRSSSSGGSGACASALFRTSSSFALASRRSALALARCWMSSARSRARSFASARAFATEARACSRARSRAFSRICATWSRVRTRTRLFALSTRPLACSLAVSFAFSWIRFACARALSSSALAWAAAWVLAFSLMAAACMLARSLAFFRMLLARLCALAFAFACLVRPIV